MRVETPPSPELPAAPDKPFSISSIHKMQGDILSAVVKASFNCCSDCPTKLPCTVAKSKRYSGKCQLAEIDFADKDFPQPGTPTNNIPRGGCKPFACKRSLFSGVKSSFFSSNHFFKPSSPPTSLTFSSTSIFSSPEISEKRRFFAKRISSISDLRIHLLATSAAITFSASILLTPASADAASRISELSHSIGISLR